MTRKPRKTPAGNEDRDGARRGRLKIGDDWNAITIIALSQSNPLKAVAEFVENAIDARARHVTITRGREHGMHYLKIADDGEGVPRDAEGAPDFRYVATHICDSLKRRLKAQGAGGIQGEFGIGLLSFWTVGEELLMASGGADGRVYQMHMRRNDPGFAVSSRRSLIEHRGTELKIRPLLPGIRHFSGEKIQWYLAAELRDRIRSSGVRITVADHQARREYRVEPREFSGRLLHELPGAGTERGEVYLELYLNDADAANRVGLFRHGTRVLESIAELDEFASSPWSSGCLQGLVDVPFLTLTPGTRAGIVRDEAYADFVETMRPVGEALAELIAAQERAAEELASREMLRSIQKAFREA
ncbi:MAG: ATP-binding protein, partial [Betaproteobacteria bacterium]|nr:ATP-binding protein [Betaproteobacteria bacterium]